MLLNKDKKAKAAAAKGNRVLITVNVLGSTGPMRFVVSENELVAWVIDTALRSYAREGRLPVLGSNVNDMLLYCPGAESDALSPWETIGARGYWNFMLCKKPQACGEKRHAAAGTSGSPYAPVLGWKSWIKKSLSLKVLPSPMS